MTEMTQQEAAEAISDLVTKAYDAISDAETLAVKFGIPFTFDIAYGMGGTFLPTAEEWFASSESC